MNAIQIFTRTTRTILTAAFVIACANAAFAQQSAPSQEPALSHRNASEPQDDSSPSTIPLTVPKDTPIHVALAKEVRVQKTGQIIEGRVVEPVYAFDQLVIPVGCEVTGHITHLAGPSNTQRTLEALNADFTPARQVEIEFDELKFADGKTIPIHTVVTPGSGHVIQFVSAADDENSKKGLTDAAAKRTKEAKQQAKQAWQNAMKQVQEPGKFHRLERFGMAELPVHPQYLDAGAVYFAELQEPLEFGTEPVTPELSASLSSPPPDGSVVHAQLVTALSSATTKKDAPVEVIVAQPLFEDKKLIVPEGTVLSGSVIQVRAARRLHRNGELRMTFHELRLPNGVDQKVEAGLAGVQAAQSGDVKLDSEGGAKATNPKTRYLATGVEVSLAVISFRGDPDAKTGNPAGTTTNRALGGLGGFKLVGAVLGGVVRSRAFGYSMGAYGSGMSVYTHFIERGQDVVFAKNTALEISVGTRQPAATHQADALGHLIP